MWIWLTRDTSFGRLEDSVSVWTRRPERLALDEGAVWVDGFDGSWPPHRQFKVKDKVPVTIPDTDLECIRMPRPSAWRKS